MTRTTPLARPRNQQPPFQLRLAMLTLLVGAGCSFVGSTGMAQSVPSDLPLPDREFRAAWVATVANIDWPSEPGLPAEKQQQEFTKLVERAKALNLNALILQVRPAADALYRSAFEPWSPYLTGKMGQAPSPEYDPLEFAIETAHRHGIELHAWFNPYRALHVSFKGEVSDDHVSKSKPTAVKKYGGYLWLDPGDRDAAQHSLDVMLDVVRRYDVDGIHLDDYFYPYPVNDDDGKEVPFPDDDSFAKAQADGYEGERDDWRRANVDWLVERLHHHSNAMKPWVRVGISPFGIWRPGHPETIKGFDAYAKLYADARKWLQEGWVDYLTPQLYWTIDSEGQSYPKLLEWWSQQNVKQIPLWPGNYSSRVGMPEGKSWPADELLNQIEVTRKHPKAGGNVLFSIKSMFDDYGELGGKLLDGPYAIPALVPERSGAAEALHVEITEGVEGSSVQVTGGKAPWLWVTWTQTGDDWSVDVLPGTDAVPKTVDAVAAVNRDGKMSQPVARTGKLEASLHAQ